MNSRYTFKAKRKDGTQYEGKWVFGYYHQLNEYGKIIDCIIEFNRGTSTPIDIDTLCQCTGLQDIDDNYIFENDIVEDIDTGDICYLVVFDEAKFKLNKNSVNYDIDGVSDFKIISNKFDKEVE